VSPEKRGLPRTEISRIVLPADIKELKMTKNDIALMIAKEMDIQQTEAKRVVQQVLDGIIEVLASEGRFELRNFGVFEVKIRKPRKARNPRTGVEVMVPERKTITFKPGLIMQQKVEDDTGNPFLETEPLPTLQS